MISCHILHVFPPPDHHDGLSRRVTEKLEEFRIVNDNENIQVAVHAKEIIACRIAKYVELSMTRSSTRPAAGGNSIIFGGQERSRRTQGFTS